jgi:hypothetical protein
MKRDMKREGCMPSALDLLSRVYDLLSYGLCSGLVVALAAEPLPRVDDTGACVGRLLVDLRQVIKNYDKL